MIDSNSRRKNAIQRIQVVVFDTVLECAESLCHNAYQDVSTRSTAAR